MRYELKIHMTEDDFTAFNVFHTTRSVYGKQMTRRVKRLIAGMFALAAVLYFLMRGVNGESVLYAVFLAVVGGLFIWRYDKVFGKAMGKNLKRMAGNGKMPYAPESRIEFYDDKLVEITPERRTELYWPTVERLCAVEGKVWYLYLNNSSAVVLPVEQIRAQTDIGEFYRFLEEKCPVVDVFEK